MAPLYRGSTVFITILSPLVDHYGPTRGAHQTQSGTEQKRNRTEQQFIHGIFRHFSLTVIYSTHASSMATALGVFNMFFFYCNCKWFFKTTRQNPKRYHSSGFCCNLMKFHSSTFFIGKKSLSLLSLFISIIPRF